MNLEQLKTFVILYDTGSFSKAEKTANLSKQSMYKQIANLECETGCPLFERSRSGIHPTAAGKIFYERAKDLLQLWNNTVADCQKALNREFIRIGSIEHQVILNPVNEVFARQHPEVELRRIVHPEHSGEYRVAHDIMDVGETFAYDKITYASIYQFTHLLDMPFLAAMSISHPLAQAKKLSLQDLPAYETYCWPMMLEPDFVDEIKDAFSLHKENLVCREDVDNQVSAAFDCAATKAIMITANPFIYSVSSLTSIPLNTKRVRHYGIIYMSPHRSAVQKYIDTAKRVYRKNPFA